MSRFVLLMLLLATATTAARAQKIIEKTAPVAAGQRVFLDLKQGSSIRIRPGAAGQLTLKASVSINQNKLNDAFQLDVTSAEGELKVASALDKELLRNAPFGDCPEGGGDYYGDSYTARKEDHDSGKRRSGYRVCADITYDITLPPGVALRVSTYSANIDIAGLSGPIEAKSLSGFVDVAWPAGVGAELALKTITGEVYTDQAIAFSSAPPKNPVVGYQLRGTLGGSGGGPLVKLESISNDVFFRKRK
ncbi:MAG: hypothetical protein M3Y54_20105 [Bacteroidota bacterium]|nr:hypothetical protein [Bacteroidota bacterium]